MVPLAIVDFLSSRCLFYESELLPAVVVPKLLASLLFGVKKLLLTPPTLETCLIASPATIFGSLIPYLTYFVEMSLSCEKEADFLVKV